MRLLWRKMSTVEWRVIAGGGVYLIRCWMLGVRFECVVRALLADWLIEPTLQGIGWGRPMLLNHATIIEGRRSDKQNIEYCDSVFG